MDEALQKKTKCKFKGTAKLNIRIYKDRINKLSCTINEENPDDSFSIANILINRLLDTISFSKNIPISIKKIES